MKEKNKALRWIKTDVAIIFVFIAMYAILFLIDETCFVKAIFGIECPSCHMTRAMICLVKLDFNGYMRENFMAVPVALCFYLQLHFEKGRFKKALDVFTVLVAIITFIKYLFF